MRYLALAFIILFAAFNAGASAHSRVIRSSLNYATYTYPLINNTARFPNSWGPYYAGAAYNLAPRGYALNNRNSCYRRNNFNRRGNININSGLAPAILSLFF
jgi:hypothetical protein